MKGTVGISLGFSLGVLVASPTQMHWLLFLTWFLVTMNGLIALFRETIFEVEYHD